MKLQAWEARLADIRSRIIGSESQIRRAPMELISLQRDALHHYDLGDITAADLARIVDDLISIYAGTKFVLPFDTAGLADLDTNPRAPRTMSETVAAARNNLRKAKPGTIFSTPALRRAVLAAFYGEGVSNPAETLVGPAVEQLRILLREERRDRDDWDGGQSNYARNLEDAIAADPEEA